MGTVVELPRQTELAARVAANVRAEAARRGWKQIDLARALGVGQPTVQRKWVGTRDWQLDELGHVAQVIGVTVETLLLPRLDSNQEPADLQDERTPSEVIDLAEYRANRRAVA